jgi:hypothetical protein
LLFPSRPRETKVIWHLVLAWFLWLFFPIRPHVDLAATRSALRAHDLAKEGTSIDQALEPTGLIGSKA